MARGSSSRGRACAPKSNNVFQKNYSKGNGPPPNICQTEQQDTIEDAIEKHWESMPPSAKTFVVQNRQCLDIYKLAKFWSQPSVVEYTRGGIAGSVCGSSWFIALNYLKIGLTSYARAMMLNGAFLQQCFSMPIESIVKVCGPEFNATINESQIPLFAKAYFACSTPDTMHAFLQKGLPAEYQHMMASFVNISTSRENAMEYVGQIGDDWGGASSPAGRNPQRKGARSNAPESEEIQIVLTDDANEDDSHTFDIGSDTTLKTLFNEYAEKRGVSLRSLRFSYNGKTLFLSSVGNKTPEEMNIRDQDVITVHEMIVSQERTGNSSSEPKNTKNSSPKKSKTKKKSGGKSKGKSKKKKPTKQHEQDSHEPSLEECKSQHSKILSKLHEEVQPQLKDIRTRLNALDLERQPKKKKGKKKNKNKKSQFGVMDISMLPNTDSSTGGKAGRPYYIVQVGEVQNLYKTTKFSASSSLSSQHKSSNSSMPEVDLHGCTKDEALAKLGESLKVWVDTAMRGSYPFVVPATIVCGCGNQVLSETVSEWIRNTRQVCNAPKSLMPR